MKIKIAIERASKLRDALHAVNGRAKAHTVTGHFDLIRFVNEARRQLSALPNYEHKGAVARCIPHGPLSRSYKYDAVSTEVEITRFASGWFLTGVERVTVRPCAKGVVSLTISGEQATKIRNQAVAHFMISTTPPCKISQ
jgi:hypothetical protein